MPRRHRGWNPGADSAPSPISVLELEDALWPESIPDNPVATLRTIISRTRSVLGPLSDHLVLNGDALSLNCQSDWREMFELLPIRDEEQDSALLEAVLDRVDGSPFVGVVNSMLVDGRRSRFEQAREQLCRQHVRLDVAEGNDESAVQRALAILETSPTDESIACLGAQALARLGRKARGIGFGVLASRWTFAGLGTGPHWARRVPSCQRGRDSDYPSHRAGSSSRRAGELRIPKHGGAIRPCPLGGVELFEPSAKANTTGCGRDHRPGCCLRSRCSRHQCGRRFGSAPPCSAHLRVAGQCSCVGVLFNRWSTAGLRRRRPSRGVTPLGLGEAFVFGCFAAVE